MASDSSSVRRSFGCCRSVHAHSNRPAPLADPCVPRIATAFLGQGKGIEETSSACSITTLSGFLMSPTGTPGNTTAAAESKTPCLRNFRRRESGRDEGLSRSDMERKAAKAPAFSLTNQRWVNVSWSMWIKYKMRSCRRHAPPSQNYTFVSCEVSDGLDHRCQGTVVRFGGNHACWRQDVAQTPACRQGITGLFKNGLGADRELPFLHAGNQHPVRQCL